MPKKVGSLISGHFASSTLKCLNNPQGGLFLLDYRRHPLIGQSFCLFLEKWNPKHQTQTRKIISYFDCNHSGVCSVSHTQIGVSHLRNVITRRLDFRTLQLLSGTEEISHSGCSVFDGNKPLLFHCI